MKKILATYNNNKGLAVRKAPGGEVCGKMNQGDSVCIASIKNGWCETENGTFINLNFVDVETVETVEDKSVENIEADVTDNEAGALNDMTVKELRQLAKESGIKIPSGSDKAEIIDLILNEDE